MTRPKWKYAHIFMADDIVVQREGVERTREWQHGPLPKDRACDGMTKPIYVPPEKLPDPCRRCGHDEWLSNGIVLRGKDTKNVVHREKGTAAPRFKDTVLTPAIDEPDELAGEFASFEKRRGYWW